MDGGEGEEKERVRMDKVSWAVVVVAIRLLELVLKLGTVQFGAVLPGS